MPTSKNQESNPLICKIEYAFFDEIETLSKIDVHRASITMKTGKVFKQLYGTPSSYSFSESPQSTPAGLLYKQTLSLNYPGLNRDAQPDIIAMEKKPVVVKITFQHEMMLIIGSPSAPAKVFSSLSSAESTAYSVTIACNSTERARFLDSD